MPITLRHEFTREFTADMDALRRRGFQGPGYEHSAREAADAQSTHLLLKANDQAAGYVRLSRPELMPFGPLSNGADAVLEGPGSIHCSRLVIAPEFRRPPMLELITYLAFNYAREQGYRYIIGGIRPGSAVLDVVARFGMVPRADEAPVSYDHPSGVRETFIPVVCDVSQAAPSWPARLAEIQATLRQEKLSWVPA